MTPSDVGLVIGGQGITNGVDFQNNFYYLIKSNLDALKADDSLIPRELGGSTAWQQDVLYSSYDNHGTPN